MNKQLIAERFTKAIATYPQEDEILLRGFAKERASVFPAGRCGNSALSCRKYPDNFLFRLAMVRISRKLFQEM